MEGYNQHNPLCREKDSGKPEGSGPSDRHMNRTVPRATTEEIQLYRSTLYSLLRSTAEIKIRTLEGTHTSMNSLMHPGARDSTPDTSAFIYSAMRLPACILETRLVVLGQNASVFRQGGFPNVEEWQP